MPHDYIHLNFHCVVGFMKCEKGKAMMSWTILPFREILSKVSRDRVVGIATRYGLDGPGVEFWWGRDFLH